MKKAVKDFVNDGEYDLVFAHGAPPACEYGFHANHAEAHDAVEELIDEEGLATRGVLYFCYRPGGGQGTPVMPDFDKADYMVLLKPEERGQKGALKTLFHSWAACDLQSLGLLCNPHPEPEAFQKGSCGFELPDDFIRIPKA
jgi:hypothetical protein